MGSGDYKGMAEADNVSDRCSGDDKRATEFGQEQEEQWVETAGETAKDS